jgi:hypothetical protein
MSEYIEEKLHFEIDHDRVLTTECAVINDYELDENERPVYIYCHTAVWAHATEWLGTAWYTTKGICAGHEIDLLWHSQNCPCGATWEYLGGNNIARTHAPTCDALDSFRILCGPMSPEQEEAAKQRSIAALQEVIVANQRQPHSAQALAVAENAILGEQL